MNPTPGKEFGAWLKAKRRTRQIIARIFAGRIGLSPAEYAEVEEGVVKWLREKQKNLIPLMLDFTPADQAQFNEKLSAAEAAGPLEFADVFSRSQLTPVRLSSPTDALLTPAKKEQILKAVFTPLTFTPSA